MSVGHSLAVRSLLATHCALGRDHRCRLLCLCPCASEALGTCLRTPRSHHQAEAYRKMLTAERNGKPRPALAVETYKKPAGPDPNDFATASTARQKQMEAAARARMRAKFGNSGGLRSQAVGSHGLHQEPEQEEWGDWLSNKLQGATEVTKSVVGSGLAHAQNVDTSAIQSRVVDAFRIDEQRQQASVGTQPSVGPSVLRRRGVLSGRPRRGQAGHCHCCCCCGCCWRCVLLARPLLAGRIVCARGACSAVATGADEESGGGLGLGVQQRLVALEPRLRGRLRDRSGRRRARPFVRPNLQRSVPFIWRCGPRSCLRDRRHRSLGQPQ